MVCFCFCLFCNFDLLLIKIFHIIFQLIELLSVRAPAPDVKLKLLKEIAEEHELDWDPSASENELLKPHEDLLVYLTTLKFRRLIILFFRLIFDLYCSRMDQLNLSVDPKFRFQKKILKNRCMLLVLDKALVNNLILMQG